MTPTQFPYIDLNVTSLTTQMQQFGWLDYFVFKLMLLFCSGFGLYLSLIPEKKTDNENANLSSNNNANTKEATVIEFLVSGKKLKLFPTALSLVASWISGVSILGIPTEIYLYGTGYMMIIFSILITGFVVHYIFLPVFVELKFTSIYEYLEARFDKKTRIFGSISFFLATLIWLPLVIYVPAIAFNQMTGINKFIIIPITYVVCIIYTSIGGIKAIIWTDCIQTIVLLLTFITIIIKSTIDIGGFGVVWERNYINNRIEFPSLTFNPTVRHSFFSLLIGATIFWIQSITVHQNMSQRYFLLSNIKSARKVLWTFIVVMIIIVILCCLLGLIVYAKYYHCDPISSNLISEHDQLLPLLVMDVFSNVPGFAGLFLAGIFSAALSTLSSGLNSISTILLVDFINVYSITKFSDSQKMYIIRSVILAFGIISVLLVFVVEQLGTILELSISLSGIVNGPLLAVFIMGLMVPWINGNSAFVGGISGIFIMSWIALKTQSLIAIGDITFDIKPVSIEDCQYDLMIDLVNGSVYKENMSNKNSNESGFYELSYLYYTLFGTVITMTVSTISMIGFGYNKPGNIKSALLAPFVRKHICYASTSDTFELEKHFDSTAEIYS